MTEMKHLCRQVLLATGTLALVTGGAVAAEEETSFDPEQFFTQGMEDRQAGKPYSSIKAFQSILNNQPALNRARLELAVAYLQTLQYKEAEAEAMKVLDDPDTPPNVRVSILAFLAKVREEAKQLEPRHESSASIAAGILFDSNVNVGPDSETININGQDLTLLPGSSAEEDTALTVNLGVDHSYHTGMTQQLGERTGIFIWQSGANYYHRGYTSEDEFDLDILSLWTGPAMITNGNWRGNLNLQFDHIRLGGSELGNFISLMPSATWSIDSRTELTGGFDIADRNYTRSGDQGRDSTYYAFDIALGRGYMNNTLGVQAGIEYIDNDADNDRYSYSGPGLFIGFNWQYEPRSQVYGRLGWRQSDYDGPEPLPPVARDEDEIKLLLGFSHLYENQWELHLDYLYLDNDSNIALYDFDRDQLNLTVSRKF